MEKELVVVIDFGGQSAGRQKSQRMQCILRDLLLQDRLE